MHRIQDLRQKDLEGKKVLVRVNFNVPIKNGEVVDDERIKASIDTISYLISKGAAVILIAHLGRPKGKICEEYSLKPIVKILEKMIKKSVQFEPDCIGKDRDWAIRALLPGEILLLENVRFHKEEEEDDKVFAEGLVKGLDLYINDAFPDSHRAHASIVGVTEHVPSYAGFAFQEEVDNLSQILKNPASPFVFIGGGAKISDKLPILENLMKKVDVMLIGGGMANTFLAADGYEIGNSLSEEECLEKAKKTIAKADKEGVAFVLPEDVVTTKKIKEKPEFDEKDIEEVEEDDIIADLGSNTILEFGEAIKEAGTIFWNGPLGICEYPEFSSATREIGKFIVQSRGFSVIGGGDTIASLPKKMKEGFDFVSLAGGACLEFLEGKTLPGIEALEK